MGTIISIIGSLVNNDERLLMEEVVSGNLDEIRELLIAGVNPDSMYGGVTPLYIAACKGDVETIELLLRYGAKIDCIGGDEGTALHAAAKK